MMRSLGGGKIPKIIKTFIVQETKHDPGRSVDWHMMVKKGQTTVL